MAIVWLMTSLQDIIFFVIVTGQDLRDMWHRARPNNGWIGSWYVMLLFYDTRHIHILCQIQQAHVMCGFLK